MDNLTTPAYNETALAALVKGLVGQDCKARLDAHGIVIGFEEFHCLCNKLCFGEPLAEEDMTLQKIAVREMMANSHNSIHADSLIIIILYMIILVTGIFGNVLVLITICRFLKHLSVTNVFICSLACADLLVIVANIPIKIWQLFVGYWLVGKIPCYLTYYLLYTTFLCSVMTLTAMSIERYLAICHPMKSQYASTTGRAKRVVISIWLAASVLGLPTILVTNYYGNTWVCNLVLHGDVRYQLYTIYLSVVIFFVPTCIMGWAYGQTAKVLWKSIKATKGLQQSSSHCKSANEAHGRLRVIRMLLVVWIVFVVSWLPFMVAIICDSFGVGFAGINMLAKTTVNRALTCLAYSNSCVNPLLYAFLSSHFRQGFLRCFKSFCARCCRRRQRPMSGDPISRDHMTAIGTEGNRLLLNHRRSTGISRAFPTETSHVDTLVLSDYPSTVITPDCRPKRPSNVIKQIS